MMMTLTNRIKHGWTKKERNHQQQVNLIINNIVSYEISFFKENRDTTFLKLYTFLNTFIKLITLNQQLVEKKGAIQTG